MCAFVCTSVWFSSIKVYHTHRLFFMYSTKSPQQQQQVKQNKIFLFHSNGTWLRRLQSFCHIFETICSFPIHSHESRFLAIQIFVKSALRLFKQVFAYWNIFESKIFFSSVYDFYCFLWIKHFFEFLCEHCIGWKWYIHLHQWNVNWIERAV